MSKRGHKSKAHHSVLDQLWFAVLLLVVIAGIVIFIWWKVPQSLGAELKSPDNKGTFGDSFGSVNALFTGLAFTGVVFSILLQQRQIRLQREDFLSQLEEMEDSRETFEQQNKLLEIQNQLMRGQIDVQILQIEARALEMESRHDEIIIKHNGPETIRGKMHLSGLKEKAEGLRNRMSVIQTHLAQADVVTASSASQSEQPQA